MDHHRRLTELTFVKCTPLLNQQCVPHPGTLQRTNHTYLNRIDLKPIPRSHTCIIIPLHNMDNLITLQGLPQDIILRHTDHIIAIIGDGSWFGVIIIRQSDLHSQSLLLAIVALYI